MISKTFNYTATDHLKAKMFFDDKGGPSIARYEELKYTQFDKFTDTQLSFFWRPEEVSLSKDKSDFKALPPEQQHIFTSNLFRQIAADTINSRGPNLVFLPIVSLPEVETWIETWSANEAVHSRAYTHIIKNIYTNPSEIFDNIVKIPEIIDFLKSISKHYDILAYHNSVLDAENFGLIHANEHHNVYEHKKALWLAMNSVNILEGIRFYVSFACSWNFAEQKLMEGNAKEIKLICRDENLHLGATQYFLRTLPKDDSDFIKIRDECKDEVKEMFVDAINQEKAWAEYLFKYGSMIGLSKEILWQYIDYIASRRMRTIDVDIDFDYPTSDPLPWTKQWISNKDVQVAPMETEITSYLVSDLVQDVNENTLNKIIL